MTRLLAVAGLVLAAFGAGCSDTGGPQRFRVSGEAKFDGQPIPHGGVLFTPDGSKQNSGPQGIAQIRNGRYDTSAGGGKGIAGGATVIRITGFSAPGGKLLCETEIQVTLPQADSVHHIDVPKNDAAKERKVPEI